MQFMPPPPPAKKPWLVIVLSVLGTVIVLGIIGAIVAQPKAPPVVITLPSPTPVVTPSPVPLPAATPVAPMDQAIQDVHEGVYIQQFCNLASRSVPVLGWQRFANVVVTTTTSADSIGRVWRDASTKYDIPMRELMQAVYQRYC